MALITGTPLGTIDTQEDTTLEGAPYLYFQRYEADPLKNPDSDNYYWGLSGTSTYNVYELGCYTDVSFGEDVTVNAVRCDKIGDKDAVQRRNYIEITLTIQTLFGFATLAPLLKVSTPTTNAGSDEKMGIGTINNNIFYMVYLPKVYDEDTGDYVMIHMHKAKIVGAFSLAMNSGDNWQLSGLTFRGYIDDTKPAGQEFGVIMRADPSAV